MDNTETTALVNPLAQILFLCYSHTMNKYNLQLTLKAAVRRNKVRALRSKGWTWTEIGKKYAISPQRAQQLGTIK